MVTHKVFRTAGLVLLLGSLPSLVFAVTAVSTSGLAGQNAPVQDVSAGTVVTEPASESVGSVASTHAQEVDGSLSLAEVLLSAHPRAVIATSRLSRRDVRIASPASL